METRSCPHRPAHPGCHTVDGEEVWKFDVGERFGRLDIQFGMTSTPVLEGDALYLQLIHGPMKLDDQTRTGKVVRLDAGTGRTVWELTWDPSMKRLPPACRTAGDARRQL